MEVRTGQLSDSWAAEVASRSGDVPEFLRYFNDAATPEESWRTGFWDFSYHILKPEVIPLIGEPFEKTVLEIGYGGGRLLQAACRHFKRGIGVDVHGHQELVGSLLSQRGVTNAQLHQTDGRSIPLGEAEVDFIYSYIVYQHLPDVEALRQNLREAARVLKPGSPAVLHFGYLPARPWRWRGAEDLASRPVAATREVTLRITMPLAKVLLAGAGFQTLRMRRAPKRPWRRDYGGQFYAIVKR